MAGLDRDLGDPHPIAPTPMIATLREDNRESTGT
jgi:hypothetical protein